MTVTTPAPASPERYARLVLRLRVFERRRRWQAALRRLPRGLLAGLLVAALLATLARLRPLLTNAEVGYAALMLALLGLLLVALTLLSPRSLLQRARYADRTFHLQERASAAVELHEGTLTAPPPLLVRQLDDAVAAVAAVDVRRALPLRAHRRDWLLLLLTALLLALALLLPNPQETILRAQRAVQETVAAAAEDLQALADEIAADPELTPQQREALLEPLQSALEALQQGDLSREEAVAALSQAGVELRELQAANDSGALSRGLAEAAQSTAADGAVAQALQAANLSQAGTALEQLATTLAQQSAQAQAQLASDLAAAAAALQAADPALAQQLATAADALQQGDVAAAQQALAAAAATLQERSGQETLAQQAAAAAAALEAGRQEVAQAGQSGATGTTAGQGGATSGGSDGQQGSGGQGGTGGAGEGSGQGGSGNGGSGSDAGGVGGGVGGIGGETGHSDNVYVPDFANLGDEPGQAVELPAACVTNPAACGALLGERPTGFDDEQSIVPYSDVYADYRDAAYAALDDEAIPLGLKGYVHDYFSSLEP
jgi:hypothetical protein